MSKRGLGKGLDALLATSTLARENQQMKSNRQAFSSDGELHDIAISNLKPGIYQPRKDIAPEALAELAMSIQSQGIIQPIIVRQIDYLISGDDSVTTHRPTFDAKAVTSSNTESSARFEIIAGERRWRAAKQAGLKSVPCIVKEVEDRGAIAMALIENIQREDLNIIEEAQALERLQDEFKLTHQQVADVIGKSRATVSNILRLNQLDNRVKTLVEQGLLEMGHARALLTLDHSLQCELAQKIADKKLTVRQTEQLVKKQLQEQDCDIKQSSEQALFDEQEVQRLSQKLSAMFEAKVTIAHSANGKAKMTISVDKPHKLAQLIAKLED